MRIISWNVNGLRATHRNNALAPVWARDPDVLCLQETKAEKEQLPEELKDPGGYHAFFSSSQEKKGYSGVAVYTKNEPDAVWRELGEARFDAEGRMLGVRFGDLIIFNVYFPNGSTGNKRVPYKLDFYDTFLEHVENLRVHGHRSILITGDVNTAHHEIDLARPADNEEHTGFLPEERAWLDELEQHGYIDAFRHFHPNREHAYTYWDMKTRARERNVGWRLDYFWASSDLSGKLERVEHLIDIEGSDHCPIELSLRGV